MTQNCKNCGQIFDEDATFCKNCGTKIVRGHQEAHLLWLRYLTIGFLVLAVLPWPYGYYLLLRVIVFFVFGYYFFHFRKLAKRSQREPPAWVWAIGGCAILFNPFMPAHLFRLLWAVFNIAGAYLMFKSIEWEKEL